MLRSLVSYCSRRSLSITSELCKGHSKWDNIKHTKLAADAIKSQKMGKLMGELNNVVVDGFDPKKNKRLADVQEKFKREGIPLQMYEKFLDRIKVSYRFRSLIFYNFVE